VQNARKSTAQKYAVPARGRITGRFAIYSMSCSRLLHAGVGRRYTTAR
jgi:hypothetical protein